jgi:hypothetical protein
MKPVARLVALFAIAWGVTLAARAADLNVVLLDSKTGMPLHRKSVCVSFHPDPRGSGLGKPDRCGRTDRNGILTIAVPDPKLEAVQVWTTTNDLLHCFDSRQQFPIADVSLKGVIAANTCGDAARKPTIAPGTLTLFAHQLSFVEVLKAMLHEL